MIAVGDSQRQVHGEGEMIDRRAGRRKKKGKFSESFLSRKTGRHKEKGSKARFSKHDKTVPADPFMEMIRV